MQIIEEHTSTVTAVRFVEERSFVAGKEKPNLQVSLLSGGADQQLLKHTFQSDQRIDDCEPFEKTLQETFSNKIFSLDAAKGASTYSSVSATLACGPDGSPYIIVGHDKVLTLRGTQKLQKKWEKRPDPRRKAVPDFLKVIIDDTGQVVVASGTDKQLCIFEADSGQLLCKALCGEITTGMCFSQNGKHLITTSSIGVVYVWKLPESITRLLNKVKGPRATVSGAGALAAPLDQIDEDENEDTLKRVSAQNSGVKGSVLTSSIASQGAPLQDTPSKQVKDKEVAKKYATSGGAPSLPKPDLKAELDDVFAQIGKVAQQVNKLENKGPPLPSILGGASPKREKADSGQKNED